MRSRLLTALSPSSTRAMYATLSSELVEADRFARFGLLQAQHGVLVRTRDPVEQRGDRARVGIGLVQRARQQRSGERSLLNVCALGEHRELGRVLGVQRDVQAGAP